MHARCHSGWQPQLTHLLESGGDDTTRRIYAGADAKRSSARSSVHSGSTPVWSPVALCRIMINHTTHHDEVMIDSLEEGQLLEDDPYLSDRMLKELGRFGMERLG